MRKPSRLFFALWPNAEQVEKLLDAQDYATSHLEGRKLSCETFHLTLIFLGEVPVAKIPILIEAATTVRFSPIELKLNLIEAWPKNNLLNAVPNPAPVALSQLHLDLSKSLANTGCILDKRTFLPHVCLMRNIHGEMALTNINIVWKISNFVLAESIPDEQGPHYKILEHFFSVT